MTKDMPTARLPFRPRDDRDREYLLEVAAAATTTAEPGNTWLLVNCPDLLEDVLLDYRALFQELLSSRDAQQVAVLDLDVAVLDLDTARAEQARTVRVLTDVLTRGNELRTRLARLTQDTGEMNQDSACALDRAGVTPQHPRTIEGTMNRVARVVTGRSAVEINAELEVSENPDPSEGH